MAGNDKDLKIGITADTSGAEQAKAAAVFAQDFNLAQYQMIGGSMSRKLAAGDTWGVALLHDKGTDSGVYGSGSGTDGSFSIIKTSD